jgi:hypothetical protein
MFGSKDGCNYRVTIINYIAKGCLCTLQEPRAPIVRFSEFLGMGYFGDEKQSVVAPIFDSRHNAEKGWARVMEMHGESPVFHAAFVEYPTKYEFIAYPLEMNPAQINYVIYRSFSSLTSLHRFKETRGRRTYIKFGWQDITKAQKFDVSSKYAFLDGVEFLMGQDIKQGTVIDKIRKNEL